MKLPIGGFARSDRRAAQFVLAKLHGRLRAPRMAMDVREGLLNDPEQR